MNNYLKYAVAFALAFFAVQLLKPAAAHDPCTAAPPPICGYQQAVNPITGQLEQHYVCQ